MDYIWKNERTKFDLKSCKNEENKYHTKKTIIEKLRVLKKKKLLYRKIW